MPKENGKHLLRIVLVSISFIFLYPNVASALDVGMAAYRNGVTLGLWTAQSRSSGWGAYIEGVVDFDQYENGSGVYRCNDGSTSGDLGRDSCAGYGGVSYAKTAKFDRKVLIAGPTYWLTDRVQIHAGFVLGLYSSDIDIGDQSALDYTRTGMDIGITLVPFGLSDFKLFLSYETERKRTTLGYRIPI